MPLAVLSQPGRARRADMMAPPPILASRERGRGRLPETIRARATLNPRLDPASGILTAHDNTPYDGIWTPPTKRLFEYYYTTDDSYPYTALACAGIRDNCNPGGSGPRRARGSPPAWRRRRRPSHHPRRRPSSIRTWASVGRVGKGAAGRSPSRAIRSGARAGVPRAVSTALALRWGSAPDAWGLARCGAGALATCHAQATPPVAKLARRG